MTHTDDLAPPQSRPYTVPVWLPVPRLERSGGQWAAGLGLGLLLVLAVCGATAVHTIEYHLGLGSGNAGAAAVAMLASCPLDGGLLVVALCAATTAFAVVRELRLLTIHRSTLTAEARRAGILRPSVQCVTLPRNSGRFAQLFVPLLGLQFACYTLVDHIWPMAPLMRMNGVLMHMAPQGAVPLLPVHLAIALFLTALVWRLERRLIILHALIATVRRLLRAVEQSRPVPFRFDVPHQRLSVLLGAMGLSRPPPVSQV